MGYDRDIDCVENSRKIRMSEISWSPQYQLIRAKLHAWNLLRKGSEADRSKWLNSRIISWTHLARDSIWREQKRLKEQASQLRVSWLQSLGEAKAELGIMTALQTVKNML
jgi:hypothetical protein